VPVAAFEGIPNLRGSGVLAEVTYSSAVGLGRLFPAMSGAEAVHGLKDRAVANFQQDTANRGD
jgi:hypothetical protein